MKKILLTVAGAMFIGLAAVNAQERTDTTGTQTTTQEQTTDEQSQQSTGYSTSEWRDEDREMLSREDIPSGLVETLEDTKYQGWENATIYRNKTSDEYMLVMQEGGDVKTFYFDKEGKALETSPEGTSQGTTQDQYHTDDAATQQQGDQSMQTGDESMQTETETGDQSETGSGTTSSGSVSDDISDPALNSGSETQTGSQDQTGSQNQTQSETSSDTQTSDDLNTGSQTTTDSTSVSGDQSMSQDQSGTTSSDPSTSGQAHDSDDLTSSAEGSSGSDDSSANDTSTSGNQSGSNPETTGATSTNDQSATTTSGDQSSTSTSGNQSAWQSTNENNSGTTAWKAEDRVLITTNEIPSSMLITLGDPMYRGWENSSVYRNRTTNEYMIEIRDGSDTRTYYFDKDGKAVVNETGSSSSDDQQDDQ